MATKTRPCTVLYKAMENLQEMCDLLIGVAGFCIDSFLKLQSGNNYAHLPVNLVIKEK